MSQPDWITTGLLTAVAMVVGAILGSWWARRTSLSLHHRASSAEGTSATLKEQLDRREADLAELHTLLTQSRQAQVQAETTLVESQSRLVEQRRMIEEMEAKLRESFEALSARALQTSADQFLSSAKKTLELVLADARSDMTQREQGLKTLVQPVADALQRFERQTQGLEQARQKAYGSLEEQVRALALTHQQLQRETGRLTTALRDPKVRGRWGELALRRTAELAGMVDHCDFDLQKNLTTQDERMRPDMIVHLPGGRQIAVDAKAVLDAYLDAVAADDEEARRGHLLRHAAQVRQRMKELSSRSYWESMAAGPEFVVLFLPGESFFSAALDSDPALIEDAIRARVIVASPTTLIALLRAVASGWRQEHISTSAAQIGKLGAELLDRLRTFTEHLSRVGGSLERTVTSYNQAIGALESRVLPSARKMQDLGSGTGDPIPPTPTLGVAPRRLASQENPVNHSGTTNS